MSRQRTRQVMNVTRQCVVADTVFMADHYFARLKGLMGKPSLPDGHGLWIVPCNDIHSCFMRFEFDAIFVNRAHQVVHLVECMPPWRISKMVKGGRAVLELPAGTIQKTGTQLGDQLELLEATP